MRVFAAVLLIVAVAISVSPAKSPQNATPPDQNTAPPAPAPRRPRIVVELSDLLTHSKLVPCRKWDAREAGTGKRVRIGTWNIRAAQSAPVDKLAAELRAMEVDVVALQEVDVGTRRATSSTSPESSRLLWVFITCSPPASNGMKAITAWQFFRAGP